jgi:hypothetical protein
LATAPPPEATKIAAPPADPAVNLLAAVMGEEAANENNYETFSSKAIGPSADLLKDKSSSARRLARPRPCTASQFGAGIRA